MNIETGHLKVVQEMLRHEHTMATVLHSIALKSFGEDIYHWDPITLDLELKDEYGIELPKLNADKLQAIITGVATDRFFRDWQAFTAICEVLNNDNTVLDLADPLSAPEMAWGVVELRLNDDSKQPFHDEVKRYVGVSLANYGFLDAPDALSWAIIPEVYHGSDYEADLHQQRNNSAHHHKLVDEYVRDQSLLLFRQIKTLPWIKESDLERIAAEIS
jgi:hypothetical protein